MNHLRKMMLEELERRNYSDRRFATMYVSSSGSQNTSAGPPTSLAWNMCAVTRSICSSNGGSHQELSRTIQKLEGFATE